jgi:threonine/homoserine/homoserine lactone efflux protein
MEAVDFVLLGAIIGVVVAAPVGPVNVMTMQRAFRYGFLAGFCAGAGAALADVLFATAAAYGLTAIRALIEGHSYFIQIVGGSLVILFGLRILFAHPHVEQNAANGPRGSYLSTSASAFAMTITNPGTIFGFLALFGALGDLAPAEDDWIGTAWLVLGVAIGTLGWWSLLAGIISHLRARLTERTLGWINHIAGFFLIAFGSAILLRLVIITLDII